MKLSDIKIQKPPEYYCKTCKQPLDPRQVAYHEKFNHTVSRKALMRHLNKRKLDEMPGK